MLLPRRKPISELTRSELRVRAIELRAMAGTATSKHISDALYRLAQRYERLADDHVRN
jgi:hypothetical protein